MSRGNVGNLYLLWSVSHDLHVALDHVFGPLAWRWRRDETGEQTSDYFPQEDDGIKSRLHANW